MTLLPVGLTPSDDVAAVLQAAGIGALIGTALAARRRIRDPGAETWLPPALWALAAAALALLIIVVQRVLST